MPLIGLPEFKLPEFKIPSVEDVVDWGEDTFKAGLESVKLAPVGGVLGGLGSVARTGLALAGGAAAGAIGGVLLGGGKQEQQQEAAPQVIDTEPEIKPEQDVTVQPTVEPEQEATQVNIYDQDTSNISNVTHDYSNITNVYDSSDVTIGETSQAAQTTVKPITELIAHPSQELPVTTTTPTVTIQPIDFSQLLGQMQEQQQTATQTSDKSLLMLALGAAAIFLLQGFMKR